MVFSILIANYNNGKYFKDCYNSIIAQTYKNWEVIIVDDCSNDNSVKIIKNLIGTDERFKLLENQQNKGCGFTKRKCVEYANGKLCGFLDPDDALMTSAIEEMVIAQRKNEHCVLIHSSLIFCNQNLVEEQEYILAKSVKVSDQFTNLDNAVTAFASFKRDFYNKSIGIDATLKRAVDQDLYLKMAETGPFYFLNRALYKYRLHDQGIAFNNKGKAFYCHIKVIHNAELRRNVNLESAVAPYLENYSAFEFEKRLNNPGFLWLKLKTLLKNEPMIFFRRIFFKSYKS